jgi:hypothetical protein
MSGFQERRVGIHLGSASEVVVSSDDLHGAIPLDLSYTTKQHQREGGKFVSANLEVLLRDFERQLAEVTQECERATQRQAALQQTVTALRGLARLNGHVIPAEADNLNIAPDAFVGMSIKQATVTYLQLVREPRTNRQIVEALTRGGITSEAANFSKTVRAVLLRDLENEETRILTWDAPYWGLREWVLPLEEN